MTVPCAATEPDGGDGIRTDGGRVSFLDYDDDCCVLMDSDRPMWLKTSSAGKWIFERAAAMKISNDELVQATAAYYGLPREAVEQPVREFVAALRSHGFVREECSSGAVERSRPDSIELRDDLTAFGLTAVWFNLLSQCNLTCSHCFLPESPGSTPISVDAAHRVLDILAAEGVKRLYLSGGEPTLHPGLRAIVSHARAISDWKLFLITNGYTDDYGLVDDLAESVDYFQISIDGIDAATHDAIRRPGSFDRAVSLTRYIGSRKTRAKTCISVTPHPLNVSQIPDMFRFAMEVGADAIYLTKPKRPARNRREGDPLLEEFVSADFRRRVYAAYDELGLTYFNNARGLSTYRGVKLPELDSSFDPAVNLLFCTQRGSCGAGGTTLCVDERGDCYPCAALIRPDCRLGNLLEEPFDTIYRDRALRGFRREVHIDRVEECRSCPFKYFCAGDCRALTDDVRRRTPFCDGVKERYHRFLTLVRPGLEVR